MRRMLASLLVVLSVISATRAASIDPSRIAAIAKAATDFLARAAEAKKSGLVPRQGDPAVGPLLDTVFDTGDLTHGPVDYGDVQKLNDWLGWINATGGVYLQAARQARDTGLFGAEIGRYYDAAVAVMRAMVDCQLANLDAHPGVTPQPADMRKLDALRNEVAAAYDALVEVIHAPGITIGWEEQRLAALRVAAPSLARFLTPAELARLRASLLQLAAAVRDRRLRSALGNLAEALATPAAPIAAPATAASSAAEIALDHDGQNYLVAVRINGASTVKFLVDSGAEVVVLPKDLVETLTNSGAVAQSDLLGAAAYVAADGKRHKAAKLMLRQLDVGGHTVTNVMAFVAPAHTAPLLGQSFLAKFKSWTLDNRRHVLIIAE